MPRRPQGYTLGGIALDSDGLDFVVASTTGLRSSPTFSSSTRVVSGVPGVVRLSATRQLSTRQITLTGTVLAPNAAALGARLDALRALCAAGEQALRVPFLPDREFLVELLGIDELPVAVGQDLQAGVQLVLRFEALDPRARALSVTEVALSGGGPVALPMGTAVVAPALLIPGPFTSVTVTLRRIDAANAIVASRIVLAFTGLTVPTGSGALIFNDRGLASTGLLPVISLVSGEWQNFAFPDNNSIVGRISSGDFFRLDPAELRAGERFSLAVSVPATVQYVRRWL